VNWLPAAGLLRVACQRQHVFRAHAGKTVQPRFEERAVGVFAGEMRDRRQAALYRERDEGVGRQSRVAAGKIGEACDPESGLARRRISDERLGFGGRVIAPQPQFRCVHELARGQRRSQEVLAHGRHPNELVSPSDCMESVAP